MADYDSSIRGAVERATSDGTGDRSEIRNDLSTLKRFGLGAIIVIALIVFGYALIGSRDSGTNQTQDELSASPRVYTARNGKIHLRQGEKAIVAPTVASSMLTSGCVYYTPRVNGRSVSEGRWCGGDVDLRWIRGSVSHIFDARYEPVTISWHQE